MSLIDRARAYAHAHKRPDKPVDVDEGVTSWAGQCAKLMFRFGESESAVAGVPWSPQAAGSATVARTQSSIHSTDMDDAAVGDFVWWSIDGVPAGHVGLVVEGSGRSAKVFMASGVVTDEWEEHIGVRGLADYTQAMGAHYKGASRDYSGATLPGIGPAGLVAQLIEQLTGEETDVIRFKAKFFYVAGLYDVRKISVAEARALNSVFEGKQFAVVSSSAAKLIIRGCRERKKLWLKDLAKASGISPASLDLEDIDLELEELEVEENGFSDEDADFERGSTDPTRNSQIE